MRNLHYEIFIIYGFIDIQYNMTTLVKTVLFFYFPFCVNLAPSLPGYTNLPFLERTGRVCVESETFV